MDRHDLPLDVGRQGDHAAPGCARATTSPTPRRPGFRAELAAFRAVPVLGRAAPARASTRSSRRRATTPTPGAVAADRAQPRRGDEGRRLARRAGARRHRGVHARRAHSTSMPKACSVTRLGLTVLGDGGPDHDPARTRRCGIAPDGTVSAAVGNAKPQHGGQAQAGDARGAAAARRATVCFAPPTATWRPTPTRALQDGALEGSERQRGGDDGCDDRRGAPVRAADEVADDRRRQRQGGGAHCSPSS